MRNYTDQVEVRVGRPEEGAVPGLEPTQFLWRGRLWKVRSVLARWVETPPWWPTAAREAAAVEGPPDQVATVVRDRECWRVEAGTGVGTGVFDLSRDPDGRWELVGCSD